MNVKEIVFEMRKSEKPRDLLYCEMINEMTDFEISSMLSMIGHYIESRR